jgi:hypothetical protein
LGLCCALGAQASPLCAAETAPRLIRIIAPSQRDVVAEMLGRGTVLPGGCQFAGVSEGDPEITAQYACATGRVVVGLQAATDPAAPRTAHLAIAVRGGPAPAGFMETLADRVRAREANLEWQTIERAPVFYVHRVLGAVVIMACTLWVSYVAGVRRRRRLAPPGSGAPCDLPPHVGRRTARRRMAAAGGLAAFYLATRLSHLTRLPAFVDEALHIEWARASVADYSTMLGFEFTTGKWLPFQFMTVAMLLPCSPLASTRRMSVAMGLATFIACIMINTELFAFGEGVLAGAVYTILPFAVLYDRMALADIYLTAGAAWTVYAALVMRRNHGPLAATGLSACLIATILSKSSGGMFLAVPVAVGALLVAPEERRNYFGRCLPALLGGAALSAFLVREGYGTSVLAKCSEAAAAHIVGNVVTSVEWLVALLTPVGAVSTAAVALWALVGAFRKRRAEAFLAALLLLAIVPYVLVARLWYPRYLLFVTVPVSLLLGRAIAVGATAIAARSASHRFLSWATAAGIAVALAVSAVPEDLALITAPEAAQLPAADRIQYISGGDAGYGFPELAAFLRAQARDGPINVVRPASPGPLTQNLNVYLDGQNSLNLFPIDVARVDVADWPWSAQPSAHETRTLFIDSRHGDATNFSVPSRLPGAVRIWAYVRPDAESALEVWEMPRPHASP